MAPTSLAAVAAKAPPNVTLTRADGAGQQLSRPSTVWLRQLSFRNGFEGWSGRLVFTGAKIFRIILLFASPNGGEKLRSHQDKRPTTDGLWLKNKNPPASLPLRRKQPRRIPSYAPPPNLDLLEPRRPRTQQPRKVGRRLRHYLAKPWQHPRPGPKQKLQSKPLQLPFNPRRRYLSERKSCCQSSWKNCFATTSQSLLLRPRIRESRPHPSRNCCRNPELNPPPSSQHSHRRQSVKISLPRLLFQFARSRSARRVFPHNLNRSR